MEISDLITEDLVVFDSSITTKERLLEEAAKLFTAQGVANDEAGLLKAFHDREIEANTGVEGGFGVPHAKSAYVNKPGLAFFHVEALSDYIGLDDGPIDCSFAIVCPEGGGDIHLDILSNLIRRLVNEDFRDQLRAAESPAAVLAVLSF